ncbi:MAG: hypothetical protein IKV41_03825 [Oscillospiraceae bacterium]|nr:hypothetical protein [Oscillospiraceae bacterium]
MKIKLEFRLGDPSLIQKELAWTEADICTVKLLEAPQGIAAQDIDVLSSAAAKVNGKEELMISDCRKQIIGTAFNGVYAVDKAWVEYFAAVPDDKVQELCKLWCDELKELFMDDEIKPTDEMCEFIKGIKERCQIALEQEKLLFQFWSFKK